mmetsp:Transcript_160276/g.307547  ORF Transcript_160276/g.307547 Transcript_160276/m.307547 type:complete len:258 (-) Transcript_160276:103-876(-)
MAQALDTICNLEVIADLPILVGRNDESENVDQLVQLDLHVEDGCLKITNASALCKVILAPVDKGLNILSRISESGKFMAWLAAVDDALVSNSTHLPIHHRFSKMHFKGSKSTLCYCADVDVLVPEEWSPTHKVLSLRLWPTGRLPHGSGPKSYHLAQHNNQRKTHSGRKRRNRQADKAVLKTKEVNNLTQMWREALLQQHQQQHEEQLQHQLQQWLSRHQKELQARAGGNSGSDCLCGKPGQGLALDALPRKSSLHL